MLQMVDLLIEILGEKRSDLFHCELGGCIILRKVLHSAGFESINKLKDRIGSNIKCYNKSLTPFF